METKMILDAIADLKADNAAIKKAIEHRFTFTADILDEHKKILSEHQQRWNELERSKRQKNIVIFGLIEKETSRHELEKECLDLITAKLKVDISIFEVDNIYRIGIKKDRRNRPVLIKFTSRRKVIDILTNTKLLKGTNIVITEDFPKEVAEERARLLPLMKEIRKEGKHAIIKYNMLYVDGKPIKKEEAIRMLQEKNEKKRHLSEEKVEEETKERGPQKNVISNERQETKRQKQITSYVQHNPEYKDRQRSNSYNRYDERPIRSSATGSLYKEMVPTAPTKEGDPKNDPK